MKRGGVCGDRHDVTLHGIELYAPSVRPVGEQSDPVVVLAGLGMS